MEFFSRLCEAPSESPKKKGQSSPYPVSVIMPNPFDAKAKKSLTINGKEYSYYSLPALEDARLSTFTTLPHMYTLSRPCFLLSSFGT